MIYDKTKIFKYIYRHKYKIFLISIFSILTSVIAVILPKISGNAISILSNLSININNPADKSINFNKIMNNLTILLSLSSISGIVSCLNGYLMTDISLAVTYSLREKISKKISKLPLAFFDQKNTGETMSLLINDIDILSLSMTELFNKIINSIILIIGISTMMLYISWKISIFLITVAPLFLVTIAIVTHKSQKYFDDYRHYAGNLNSYVEEIYSNHNVIKLFNNDQHIIQKFADINNNIYTVSRKADFISSFSSPIILFLSNIVYIGICLIGAILSIKSGMSIGDISAFIIYSNQIISPISEFVSVISLFQQSKISLKRISDFLREPVEENQNKRALQTLDSNLDITFKNVCFHYSDKKCVLNNINLCINHGKSVAIVGPTGSGKSTIIKLIMKFYSPINGEICIGSSNIQNVQNATLRNLIGLVPQDVWLFKGTIKENIRFSNFNATDDDIINACKLANIHDFICKLPLGYDTMLDESCDNLSKGQKQLIAIARVFLKKPKIYILDEATSSVDTLTEHYIQNAIKRVMKKHTSIIIAHRLSTIQNADLILVINNGKIVQSGTHTQLVNDKCGLYYEIYNSKIMANSN